MQFLIQLQRESQLLVWLVLGLTTREERRLIYEAQPVAPGVISVK